MTTSVLPEAPSRTSFRRFLQEELARRCSKNARYSLRAFAAQLGVDHSTLSQILRGKRALTSRTIAKLGTKVGLEPVRIESYVQHREPSTVDDRSILREVRALTHDTAQMISEGYDYAILELTRLESFKADTRWMARVLGTTPDEVKVALTRLVHLGFLEMQDRNRWVDKSAESVVSFTEFSRAAVRRLLERVEALTASGAEPRPSAHSSTTIAVRTAQLPEALARFDRFRTELLALLEREPERDDVYQLELHFFPLTTLNPRDKESP